ncbi:MAG: cation:dicarboxylase symporter family transporter [Selenomonadaceae bacterium]|nr:cation:dicarboxylase symporter family transporter [Selenomonadaceae bacterium]
MKLSNQNIAEAMESVEKFFDSLNVARQDKLKICILLEDSLLRYQEKFGEGHEFKFVIRKWLGTPRIVVKVKGEPYNPIEYDGEEEIFSESIFSNLLNYENARLIYRYEYGFNEIIAFSAREVKKFKIIGGSSTVAILFAIVFAMIFGNFSSETQNLIVTVITPILSTLIGIIIAVNTPFIFVSVVASICAMENMVTLNTIGTTVLLRFIKILLFIIVVTIFVSEMFFPIVDFSFNGQISTANSDEANKIFNLILSIIPQNIVDPFLKGNILQIVVLALLMGVCVTILGDRVTDFKKIVVDSKQIVFKMVSIVLKLIPAVIFLSILKTLLVYSLDEFYALWKILAASYISFIIVPAAMLLRISIKHGVKISDFMRKIYPACLITFTTGSGSASMPKNLEICKQELHINENLCDFYIMLSHALCPTTMTISIIISAFFAAEFSGMTMTISQLIIIAFLSVQFAISTVKENGGIIATITLLLTQFSFSMDSIGLLMAASIFTVNISGAIGIIIRDCDLYDLSKTI